MRNENTLLLATHVPIRRGKRGPQIDEQTAAGIAQWCQHFDSVTYYGIADRPETAGTSSSAWVDARDLFDGRAEIIALPRAYRPGATLSKYNAVRSTLRDAITRHAHLCFTFGGILGDWPAVAALEAIRQRRRYGAWIDRVEAPVIRNRMADARLTLRLAAAVAAPLGEQATRYLVKRSAVALLQGCDTFEHYQRWASNPQCTYDTHTRISDRIDVEAITAKQARLLAGDPLRIVYAGRAAAMKGSSDWLDALDILNAQNVPFRATWVGDGPDLAAMRDRVATSGLTGKVDLPGFLGDREILLRRLRERDMLLFCHKTPESARCLIEALVSGCPLVGYSSAYARGLVDQQGGGALTPPNDVAALAAEVAALHNDRARFAALISAAASSGRLYDEDSVYTHRAGLMRLA